MTDIDISILFLLIIAIVVLAVDQHQILKNIERLRRDLENSEVTAEISVDDTTLRRIVEKIVRDAQEDK